VDSNIMDSNISVGIPVSEVLDALPLARTGVSGALEDLLLPSKQVEGRAGRLPCALSTKEGSCVLGICDQEDEPCRLSSPEPDNLAHTGVTTKEGSRSQGLCDQEDDLAHTGAGHCSAHVDEPFCLLPASPYSPRCVTRSKGHALVEAALETLAVGVYSHRGSCSLMEDRHSVSKNAAAAVICVCDGHGGQEAADFCSKRLQTAIIDNKRFCEGDVGTRDALIAGFEKCEVELVQSQQRATKCSPAGTTAVVLALVCGGRCLNLAWLGDSQAVLCRGGEALCLTPHHRPYMHRERIRVQREGGTIKDQLLGGSLKITRALGALDPHSRCKPAGLSSKPEVWSEALRSEDEFILLGSHGLWDVLSAEEAVRISRSELQAYDDPRMVAEKLVDTALTRCKDDNITAIVVRLFSPRASHKMNNRPRSFVDLPTAASFVRVVGGF